MWSQCFAYILSVSYSDNTEVTRKDCMVLKNTLQSLILIIAFTAITSMQVEGTAHPSDVSNKLD